MNWAILFFYSRKIEHLQAMVSELMMMLQCQSPVFANATDRCTHCKQTINFDWETKTWKHLGPKKRHVPWPTYYKMWVLDDEGVKWRLEQSANAFQRLSEPQEYVKTDIRIDD